MKKIIGSLLLVLMYSGFSYATGPTYSYGWDEPSATLTVGNSTQTPTIQFPTASIQSETGELLITGAGTEGVLVTASGPGDILINIPTGPILACYAPGSYQGGNFFNFNKRVRIDEANTDDEPSAQLNIASTTRGLLPPRMTSDQRNAISSPAEGLEVWDLTVHKHYQYNGSTWTATCSN